MGSGSNIVHPSSFDGMYNWMYVDRFFVNHGRKLSLIFMITQLI